MDERVCLKVVGLKWALNVGTTGKGLFALDEHVRVRLSGTLKVRFSSR